MELGDLYLHIGPPVRRDRHCPLTLRWLSHDGELQEMSAVEQVPKRRPATPAPDAQSATRIADALQRHLLQHPGVPPGQVLRNLLVDVAAADLFTVDWEAALRRPGLPTWEVVRFIDRSDRWVGIPFELPARLLRMTAEYPSPSDASPAERRYFRLHRVSGLDGDDLLATLRRDRFEIVHLLAGARWDSAAGEGRLTVAGANNSGAEGIGAATLADALKACGARFLVIQCAAGGDYEVLLDLSHRVQRRSGPTTALFEAAQQPDGLDSMYMGIVHDHGLTAAVRSVQAARTALFQGIGGAHALAVARLGNHVRARVARADAVLTELEQDGRVAGRGVGPAFERAAGSLEGLKARAADLAGRIYRTASESGAWIPIGKDMRDEARLRDDVESAQASLGRVVNVGVLREGRRLTPRDSLLPRERYELAVQIGRAADWSLVKAGRPIPEAELARHYQPQGLPLRVVVFANGFDLDWTESVLMLPSPPQESREVRFALGAPQTPGAFRVRVALYHENNLLQSILMRVRVQAAGEAPRRGPAVHAEVEFALSQTLTNPERLPARTMNFLINAGDDGTHTFAIVGKDLVKNFDFGEGKMRAAVGAARSALSDIAADRSSGKPRYRFDADNRAPLSQLAPDVVRLAERGHALFSTIVTGEDRAFKAQLLAALGTPGATIQVSATKSAQYVFPWSLVYDHPLVVGASTLCPQFVADLQSGRPLAGATCFTSGCPHRSDTAIVCPSGFWGFKHRLEQPLSVKTKPGPLGPKDLMLELAGGPPNTPVPALMAVSRELEEVREHEREMRANTRWQLTVKDSKADVLVHMQDAARIGMPLLYFYCHGGRSGSDTWLGIGRGERLVPGDLEACEIDWSAASPLVMINGCHTADLSPDDLLHFNQTLAWCRAAGVIGTEIDVTESLARDFARGFLEPFGRGACVGDALRLHRLSLLERCNPLGLAYTPYCSASLQLVRK